jgi:hypothetical protein
MVLTDTYAKEGLADRIQEIKKEFQDTENLAKEELESKGDLTLTLYFPKPL